MNRHPSIAILTPQEPRTLAHVLLDIAEARSSTDAAWDLHVRHAGTDEEDFYTERMCRSLNRLDEVRDEARAMIEHAVGVTWDQISEACL